MKKLILTLILCLFTLSANAKVTVAGTQLQDKHINVIKGHLYDYSKTSKLKDFVVAVKTVMWITKLHENEKTYELMKKKNKKDKRLLMVLSGINFYAEIERGEHLPKLSKANIYIWHELGKRVVATHKSGLWELKLK
jgi:hypothetical protein